MDGRYRVWLLDPPQLANRLGLRKSFDSCWHMEGEAFARAQAIADCKENPSKRFPIAIIWDTERNELIGAF